MSDDAQASVKAPTLFRNYISFAGALIVVSSLASIILLFLIELTKAADNPYLGIVTYIVLPAVLTFGLVIIAAGMLVERRRRKRRPESEIAAYPRIDLNDPRPRRIAFSLIGVSFIFIFMSAFGSYRAYDYSESVEFCGKTCHSVMKPEFVAFQAASHARTRQDSMR